MSTVNFSTVGMGASLPPSRSVSASPAFGSQRHLQAEDRFSGTTQKPTNAATNQKALFCCTVPCGAAMTVVGAGAFLIPVVGPFIGVPLVAIGLISALNPLV